MPPVIESQTREGEEPVKLPPTVNINSMADKFREAMNRMPEAKPEPAPEPKPESKPEQKPEPKPEPKPVQAKQEKPKEQPKIPSEHFKVLETQRDEFKTKYEQAEAKARELEAKSQEWETKLKETQSKIPSDYDQLKASLAEAEQFRQKFYVEQSPQFKAAFDDKIQASIEDAKEIVGSQHADAIAELLTLPPSAARDKRIAEVTEELTSFQQAALVKSFTDVRRLQKERSAELAKSAENYKHLKDIETQNATKQKLQQEEEMSRSLKLVAMDAAKRFPEFRLVEGNDEHNAFASENQRLLQDIAGVDLSPDKRAKLSMWAAKGIASEKTDMIKDAIIAKLQKQLQDITSASPKNLGGGDKGEKTRPMTAQEKFKQAMTEGIPEKGS